jgi:hypothetical protein
VEVGRGWDPGGVDVDTGAWDIGVAVITEGTLGSVSVGTDGGVGVTKPPPAAWVRFAETVSAAAVPIESGLYGVG